MSKAYVLKINQFLDKKELPFLDAVSDERRQQIMRFLKKEDACRSLIGGLLARYALCRELQCNNSKLLFDRNEFGKPNLVPTLLNFNITHSGSYVACIIDEQEAGIDVEKIEERDLSIAHRFYHDYEYRKLLETEDEKERNELFYFYWSMKEAYVKALGKGLSRELSSFYVRKEGDSIAIVDEAERKGCFPFCTFFVKEEYGIAAAAKTAVEWEHLDDTQLYQRICSSGFFR